MPGSTSPVRLIGGTTAAVLALLGAIHVYWAAGGTAGCAVAVPERDGQPLFQPSPAATPGVAGALLGAACLVLARLGLVRSVVSECWTRRGVWLLAGVFVLRAMGDFHYVGLFKRVRTTAFARWDTWLYTPLCLLLALGSASAAATGPARRA
jgi:hypothetical protein